MEGRAAGGASLRIRRRRFCIRRWTIPHPEVDFRSPDPEIPYPKMDDSRIERRIFHIRIRTRPSQDTEIPRQEVDDSVSGYGFSISRHAFSVSIDGRVHIPIRIFHLETRSFRIQRWTSPHPDMDFPPRDTELPYPEMDESTSGYGFSISRHGASVSRDGRVPHPDTGFPSPDTELPAQRTTCVVRFPLLVVRAAPAVQHSTDNRQRATDNDPPSPEPRV
jgi:hypothetical protein